MDEKFIEKLSALLTIAAFAWFVIDHLSKGAACCASCADGPKRPRGWKGGAGDTACTRSMWGSPPPRGLPVSTSDSEPSEPADGAPTGVGN